MKIKSSDGIRVQYMMMSKDQDKLLIGYTKDEDFDNSQMHQYVFHVDESIVFKSSDYNVKDLIKVGLFDGDTILQQNTSMSDNIKRLEAELQKAKKDAAAAIIHECAKNVMTMSQRDIESGAQDGSVTVSDKFETVGERVARHALLNNTGQCAVPREPEYNTGEIPF